MRTVLAEGYRAFFLAAGLFGVLAMTVWALSIALPEAGHSALSLPLHWHAHEMIFGYAGAAFGGFFLTAVPAWTGTRAARRAYIVAAVGFWLAGRMAVACSDALDPVLTAIIDLCFLPFLAVKIAGQLMRKPQPRNLMFLGLIALIWASNLTFHLGAIGLVADGMQPGLRAGLVAVVSIIAVIGGRVTPAFTRNAMTRTGIESGLPRSRRIFEAPGIVLAIALPVLFLASAPDEAIAVVALLAGAAQLLRLSGWRTDWVLGQPILWSLHLGFAMLGAGYIALGLAHLEMIDELAALHILGIGAVGGMTLAVMSRAILGHAGQPLVVARAVAVAYLLVAAAAILRACAGVLPAGLYLPAILGSAALWITAFTLFVMVYWPIVTRPSRTAAAPG